MLRESAGTSPIPPQPILLREWDMWYFIAPRMSVGVNMLWYDASNLRNGQPSGQNLSICSSKCSINAPELSIRHRRRLGRRDAQLAIHVLSSESPPYIIGAQGELQKQLPLVFSRLV